MSYIDETYGKQLEEALRGLVSRPALGQPWFGFHASEVPAGVLLFTATTHSRVLYADFWKYIQDKNLVKTEEEWQSIYSEQGWCPFYSDGDGIDTFRMPSPPLYLKGADSTTAGQYVEAGLPKLEGSIRGGLSVIAETDKTTGVGVFANSPVGSGFASYYTQNNTQGIITARFNAANVSPVFGKSDTVTPETSKMLFGVWAISAPQQPIPDATVEGIISELGVASNNALEANTKVEIAINGLNGVVRTVNGVNADMAGNVAIDQVYSAATAGWANGANVSDSVSGVAVGYLTTSFTLPAGGTWKYVAFGASNSDYLNVGKSGTSSGGSTITCNYNKGGWYIAVRIA